MYRFFYDAFAANHVQWRWICNLDVHGSETIKVLERGGERERELSSSPPREVSEVGITFASDRRGELPRISRRRAAQPVNNYPRWRVPRSRPTLCIVIRWPETTSTMHLAGEWASHILLRRKWIQQKQASTVFRYKRVLSVIFLRKSIVFFYQCNVKSIIKYYKIIFNY